MWLKPCGTALRWAQCPSHSCTLGVHWRLSLRTPHSGFRPICLAFAGRVSSPRQRPAPLHLCMELCDDLMPPVHSPCLLLLPGGSWLMTKKCWQHGCQQRPFWASGSWVWREGCGGAETRSLSLVGHTQQLWKVVPTAEHHPCTGPE